MKFPVNRVSNLAVHKKKAESLIWIVKKRAHLKNHKTNKVVPST
jgi:hypothetical protein